MTQIRFKSFFPATKKGADPYSQQITAQAIALLYRNMFRSGIMITLMMLITIWVMWSHIEHATLFTWCAIAFTATAARFLVIWAYRRQKPAATDAPRWGRYYTYVSFGHGVTWGLASFLFFVPDSVPLQVFLLFIILTMSVGAIALHAYWLESYYALLVPIYSMLGISLMMAGGEAYRGLALGIIPAGLVVLFHIAKNANREAIAAIRLRFENLDLVEQLRAERDNAETANHDKTRFLASASHDLRQPVQALTLFAHALQHELKEPKALALLDDMGRSIEALNQLLVSLLDISKLDAGIVKPNKTHFDPQDLVEVLETEYAPQARAKGLTFQVEAEGELIVHSDRALLETMLRNLISNALRYTNSGGVSVRFSKQDGEVRAEVRDTGIGIAPEQHEDIFREFYQITNPERDRSKGLGLGLAIVRRLAALMEHRVEITSELGSGSRFSIILPEGERTAMPWPEAQPPYLGQRDINGLRVLVIDDEVAVREGMQAVLQGWGCETILAASENEALEKLQDSEAPHAIISDYRLRDGKNGAQAIAILRSKFGYAIPAMIVTGDTDPERLREAQASGVALMHKPLQPAKLRAYLRTVQRRKA
jgi:signal transduction histidine kinase